MSLAFHNWWENRILVSSTIYKEYKIKIWAVVRRSKIIAVTNIQEKFLPTVLIKSEPCNIGTYILKNTFRVDRMTTFTELLASFSNKAVNTIPSRYEADFNLGVHVESGIIDTCHLLSNPFYILFLSINSLIDA